MIISYYGLACFKIQSGETVLATDPYGKGTNFTPPRFEAGVIVYTDPHAKQDSLISGDPFIFSTPGEYETKNISFTGFQTPSAIPFFIEWEGMRLLHLGELGDPDELETLLDHIGTIDILFISTASAPNKLQKIVTQIDPRIVIPMQTTNAKKGSLELFLKEVGEKPEKLDKLTIKQKGLPVEGQRLVVLEAFGS
jgi:L-ascorbate metabolism protein UlaG (beta-lactamase superfamily)